tara:strand:+ start:6337 stop:6882 length:546 start_codon:yes stop_codon:yes gene_type:complete
MQSTQFEGTLLSLRRIMRKTEQMPNLSVLGHGIQVARYFNDMKKHVLHGKPLKYEWKLPEWALSTMLWESLPSEKQLSQYHWFHDCGKPFCRTVDEQGRQHFPDHANVSADIWHSLTGDEIVSTLIRRDIDIHLFKGNQVNDFAERPYANALLLTGLSEYTQMRPCSAALNPLHSKSNLNK